MNIFLFLAILVVCASALRHFTPDYAWVEPTLTANISSRDIPEKWFTNYVDHFNPLNVNTYQQRYFENDEFFQPYNADSPIFIYLGLEGAISSKSVTSGLMYEWSRRFGAHLIVVEHRYYGKSVPTPDLSINNLAYLTTSQAIEDYAYFIKSFSKFSTRPWIAFSGSYGGVLCVDMRMKFPHLIAGVVSASGPFEPTVDFQNYYVVAEKALEFYGGVACVDDFEAGNKQLFTTYLKDKNQVQMDKLTKELHLCTPLKANMSPNDVYSIWQSLTDSFMEIVQYNKETVPAGKYNIKKVCEDIRAADNKMEALLKIHNTISVGHGEECRPWDYKWQVDQLSDIKPSPSSAMRQWIFQSCSQYGFFQTNVGKTRAFGQHFPLEFFGQICQDAFSPEFNLNRLEQLVARQNATYGGRDIRTRGIIIANGSIDPWHALSSPKHNKYEGIYNYFITGTSHCAILYASSPTDPQTLVDARASMLVDLTAILREFPFTLQSTRASPFIVEPDF